MTNLANDFIWGVVVGFLVCFVLGLGMCSPNWITDEHHQQTCRAEMNLLPTGADSVAYLIKDSWCIKTLNETDNKMHTWGNHND
jgi:hypothetical protein